MTARKPKRPPGLADGRWLGDFDKLSPAEEAFVAASKRGEAWVPVGWDGERPERETDANRIRADLVRFLLLGGDGDHPVHEVGVTLYGAWIVGTLRLHQAVASVRLAARQCHFVDMPDFMKASLPELSLIGCHCPASTPMD